MKRALLALLILLVFCLSYSTAPAQLIPNQQLELSATTGNQQLNLTWKKPVGFVNEFAAYRVYSGTAPIGVGTFALQHTATNYTDTTHTIASLTNAITTYSYVAYVDTNMNERFISNVIAKSPTAVTSIAAPQLIVIPVDTVFGLIWNKNATPTCSKYYIYWGTNPNPTVLIDSTASINDTVYVTSLFSQNVCHYFRVVAKDASGTLSGYSNEVVSKLLPNPLSSPTGLTAQAGNNQIQLHWNPISTINCFREYRAIVRVNTQQFVSSYYTSTPGNQLDTALTINNLPYFTTYHISLCAVDVAGNITDTTNEVSIYLNDTVPPPAPLGGSVLAADEQLTVKWNAVSNLDGDFAGYRLFYDTLPNAAANFITIVGLTTDTTATLSNLINYKTYYFKVQSVDAVGNFSSFSPIFSGTPIDLTAPLLPQNFTATIDSGRTKLSWQPSFNVDNDFSKYYIYRNTLPGQNTLFDSISNVNQDTLTIENLTNGQTYFFSIRTKDIHGNISVNATPEIRVVPARVEKELNDSWFIANELGNEIIGKVYSGTDEDYFKFTLTGPSQVTIETNNIPLLDTSIGQNVGNTVMYLYGTLGTNQLAFNNNYIPNGQYSRIDQYIANAGTYYVRVVGGTSQSNGYYRLSKSLLTGDNYENNNSIYAATPLSDTTLITDLSIFPASDFDIFEFISPADFTAEINFYTPYYTGTISIIDSANNVVQTINSNNLNFIVPDSGRWYVKYEIGGFTAPQYTLDFKLIPPVSYNDIILINEVMYANSNLQYIELYNNSFSNIDLAGFMLTGINYTFPANSTIIGNDYYVLAKDSLAFANHYGFGPNRDWGTATLPNATQLLLSDTSNQLVDVVAYSNSQPWPTLSNANRSLELDSFNLANNVGLNWQQSSFDYGTPAHFNSLPIVYSADNFEPNNNRIIANLIDYETLITASLSELSDTTDWYYYRLKQNDSLTVSFSATNSPNLKAQLSFYNNQNGLISTSGLIASNQTLQFVASQDTVIYVALKIIADSLPFIINEGNYVLTISHVEMPESSPWEQNFESYDVNTVPADWRVFNLDGNNQQWTIPPITIGYNATKGLALAQNPNGNNDWLILPPLSITLNDVFYFYSAASSGAFPETMLVYVGSENATTPYQFTTVLDTIVVSSATYQRYEIDLNNYAGQTIRVAFRNISVNQNEQYLDKIGLATPNYNAVVKGIVKDFNAGTPIVNADVTLNGQTVQSSATGYFEFTQVTYGNAQVNISKTGYTPASFTYLLAANDTVIDTLSIIANQLDTIYFNQFDTANTPGVSSSTTASQWRKSGQFAFGSNTISAQSPDTMLAVGGSTGYQANTTAVWRPQPTGFNFNGYNAITLQFDINYNTEINDKFYLFANGNLVIDINGDGNMDSLDFYSGNSGGWQHKTISLDNYSAFNDLELWFMFASNATLNQGFGIALDNILITGYESAPKPTPTGAFATSFLNDTVRLQWNNTPIAAQYYNIYKRATNGIYYLYTATTDSFYTDTNVVNFTAYSYKVSAQYSYGESFATGALNATPGIPVSSVPPLIEYFETTVYGNKPAGWYTLVSSNNPWLVGDSSVASAFNNYPPQHSSFIYSNFFTIGVLNANYTSILASPWLNCVAVNNNVVIDFSSVGTTNDEYHILVIKTGLNDPWMVVDTIDGSTTWQDYRYDVTSIVAGEPFVQFGFLLQKDSLFLNTYSQGWAIDDVQFKEILAGVAQGGVASTLGASLGNATVSISAQTNRILNVGQSKTVFTDATGFYSTANSYLLYDDLNYNISATSPYHSAGNTTNSNLQGSPVLIENFTLNFNLPAAQNLTYTLDTLSRPNLKWQAPPLFGELKIDNNNFGSNTAMAAGNSATNAFHTGYANGNKIEQLAFYGNTDASGATISILFCSKLANNLPNIADTLYFLNNIAITATTPQWNFITINDSVAADDYYAIITLQSGNVLQLGYASQAGSAASLYQIATGSPWFAKPEAAMIRVYETIGNASFNYTSTAYNGTYSIFRKLNTNATFDTLATGVTLPEYLDAALLVGDSGTYFVQAVSPLGYTDSTNMVAYRRVGAPFLVAPDTIRNIVVDYGQSTVTDTLHMHNAGLASLNYQLTFSPGFVENHVLDLPLNPASGLGDAQVFAFQPLVLNQTVAVPVYLANINASNENITSISFDFPTGIWVQGSQNLDILNSNNFMLSSNTIGNGAVLNFTDPTNNSNGDFSAMKAAKTTLNLRLDTGFNATPYFIFTLTGDNGSVKTDTCFIQAVPFVFSYSPQSSSIPSQQALSASYQVTSTTFPTAGQLYPGYTTISSNDPQVPLLRKQMDVIYNPALGSIHGTISDANSGQGVAGAVVTIGNLVGYGATTDTTDANGFFMFNTIPIGSYTLSASHPLYNTKAFPAFIPANLDTVFANTSLTPILPLPENLTVNVDSFHLRLDWQIADFVLNYDMETNTSNPNQLVDWTGFDLDGDGSTWQYYGVGPYQGLYSIASFSNASSPTNNWMVSQPIRITETNSSIAFYAAPQDANNSQEAFNLRVSTTGGTPANFGDTLINHVFQAGNTTYQQFTADLSSFLGDTIWLGFQCYSNMQYALKIDSITIHNAQYSSVPADSGIYHFNIFRSANLGAFNLIDTLTAYNDTVSYLDTTVQFDTLYTYYVTHAVPAQNIESAPSNFATNKVLSVDASITQLLNPTSSQSLGNAEQVTIRIKNSGSDTLVLGDTLFVAYQIDNGAVATDIIAITQPFAPNATQLFTFNQLADLSVEQTYQIKAWLTFDRDVNAANDTLDVAVVHQIETNLPLWTVNPFAYQYSMTLTAEVTINDTLSIDTADIVGAFVGNDVRGVANIQYVQVFNKYLIQMTIYSNNSTENIAFKVYDASNDTVLPILENYTFLNNQVYGSLINPEQLHTASSTINFDMSVHALLSPQTGLVSYAAGEIVSVQLKNVGTQTFQIGDSVVLGFSIEHDGSTVYALPETIVFGATLANTQTLNYTFLQTANLQDTGLYTIKAYCHYSNDINATNDTLVTTIQFNQSSVPTWSVNPSLYQYNTFLTAKLLVNDTLSTDTGDIVGAFVNNECRGVGKISYSAPFNVWVVQMAIYSSSGNGDLISFRAYDASSGKVLGVDETFVFIDGFTIGTLVNPEKLHTNGIYNAVELIEQGTVQLFPNPFNENITFTGLEDVKELRVTNLSGQVMHEQKNITPQLTLSTANWPQGAYFVSMQTKSTTQVFKVLKIN